MTAIEGRKWLEMRTELWVQSAGKEFHYRSCVSLLPTSARWVKEIEEWMRLKCEWNIMSTSSLSRRILWRGIGFINNLPSWSPVTGRVFIVRPLVVFMWELGPGIVFILFMTRQSHTPWLTQAQGPGLTQPEERCQALSPLILLSLLCI